MTAPRGNAPRAMLERAGPRSVTSVLGFEVHQALPRQVEYREGARSIRFAAARSTGGESPGGAPAEWVVYDGLGSSHWEPPYDAEAFTSEKKHQILVRITAALSLLELSCRWEHLAPGGSPHDWRAIQAEASALIRRAE